MRTKRAFAESSTAARLNVCHMKIANPRKTNTNPQMEEKSHKGDKPF